MSESQKYINAIVDLFGISFRNNQQQDICLKWLKEYGYDRTMEVFEYYRLKGDSLGPAIAKMKRSLPKWKWDDIVIKPSSNIGGNGNGYNV
jgi:hypothetical protein